MNKKIETEGKKPEVPAYKAMNWSEEIVVYVCNVCGHQEDKELDMIAHVLVHSEVKR